MQQKILLLSLTILCVLQAHAQVTITRDDFPRMAAFTDSAHVILNPGIDFPAEGPDQVWDYSNLASGEVHTDIYFDATANPVLTDALTYFHSNLNFTLAGFPFEVGSSLYENVDDAGWYRTGRTVDTLAMPLSILTGNADDVLVYPKDTVEYIGRLNLVQFPLNYQDQWSGTYQYDIDFAVTVSGFGLFSTPGFTRTTYSNEREVVGYGSLIMPDPEGNASAPMDVLLAKVNITSIDSTYLNGAPAPQVLLDTFGIEQGAVFQDSFYVFYRPGFGGPVILFEAEGTPGVGSVTYRTQAAEIASSTEEVVVPVANGFPNPVLPGSSVTIQLDHLPGTGQIQFVNLHGQKLRTVAYSSSDNRSTQLTLPDDLPPGVNLYQVIANDQTVVGVGKLLVLIP